MRALAARSHRRQERAERVAHAVGEVPRQRNREGQLRGRLSRMLREALEYIRRNYIQEIVTKHADRAEATRSESFAYAAVEEAVVNAIYHRGYDTREPVEVRISPEDLVVLSYPGPDRAVRLEQLRDGRAAPRRYRNRRIGEFLKELDLTEGRATGIPKMLRVMRANGSPPPEFEFDEDHSYFMVRLPVHPKAIRDPAREAESGAESLDRQMLSLVAAENLAKAQIDVLLNRPVAGALNRRVRNLLDRDLVEYTIPDKPRSRLQKYRITEQGRAWLRGDADEGEDDG